MRRVEDAAGQYRQPVRIRGRLTECDPATGDVIRTTDTGELPGGYLPIPCGNRREQVCPPCSKLYKGDTYRVMIAGLHGGHGMPGTVSSHPAVFVTLTAPSFGAVHRGPGKPADQPARCRPRRGRPLCEHGRRHHNGDPAIGQPLCGDCFNYAGAVLFNASVPALWNQTTHAIKRQLGTAAGLTQRALHLQLRLTFGKVIEYQHRGPVHIHAITTASTGRGEPATSRRPGPVPGCSAAPCSPRSPSPPSPCRTLPEPDAHPGLGQPD